MGGDYFILAVGMPAARSFSVFTMIPCSSWSVMMPILSFSFVLKYNSGADTWSEAAPMPEAQMSVWRMQQRVSHR